MYCVTVQSYFWASHSVAMPDGSLEPRHSHNFAVEAKVSSEDLNSQNMVVDFVDLKKALDDTAAVLSGKSLGQVGYFQARGQAAEVIAEFFFEKIQKTLPREVTLDSVTVEETPGCCAGFSR